MSLHASFVRGHASVVPPPIPARLRRPAPRIQPPPDALARSWLAHVLAQAARAPDAAGARRILAEHGFALAPGADGPLLRSWPTGGVIGPLAELAPATARRRLAALLAPGAASPQRTSRN
ncbi:MAG: hypothetical protein D6832_03875 [Alphaproteobacteria bacterium]|nr:MAG: hypothetical protein D6832_03875 [Alphaproteobacteria bacterium]